MLGTALLAALKGLGHQILATDIINVNNGMQYLDVQDQDSVRKIFAEFKPDIVFHLAAATDVDRCETQAEQTFMVNTLGTENIVFACMPQDTKLVYISTAAVFDGKKLKPYTELDQPRPLNIYAWTKFEGEKVVERFLKRYFIVRAGWMIGGIDKDKKFVFKIIKQLQKQKEIMAVTDKKGSPTFTKDLAAGLVRLLEFERYGLYHMANRGSCSRYDIAKQIVKLMARDDVTVKAVTSEAFPLPAPRPDSEAIENFKLNLLGMNKMQPWEEALAEYISIVKNSDEVADLK